MQRPSLIFLGGGVGGEVGLLDGIGDAVEEKDRFQLVNDRQSRIQYTTMLIIFVICIRNRSLVQILSVELF